MRRRSVFFRLVGLGLLVLAAAAWAAQWPWDLDTANGPLTGVFRWLSLGLTKPALEQAESTARLRPFDPEAHLVLALILQERGDQRRAEAEYRLAFPDAKDRPYLLTALGQLYLSRGEWRRAADIFAEASSCLPGLAQAEFGRAQALAGAADRWGAIEILRELVGREAGRAWPEAFLYLGDLLVEDGAGPQELLPLYEQGVAANPTEIELRLRLARTLSDLGDPARARREYAIVFRLDPENSEARQALGKE